ncbi:MAG: hypothetical protein A2172_00560 [Candidatus Woykebacteria bacterium RBG_13_40_15]|uniref:Small-conductance mechanosensitive ion channel n=1 Tax=Candidatus Woykebacteria bacterium RBG_13_40_15 TaxID=1802593 RepID=A0A1G1W9N2_9BACT|nr:MAG: hypothetical protein A2172_00560 [Candidatus Woykebacteria bacterium RBG_13_40_15]
MTFQDYINLSQDSIRAFFNNFLPVFTNILAAVIAIIIGLILGWILKRIVQEVSKVVGLERVLSSVPAYSGVVKADDELELTNMLGEVVRWIAIIVFLIPAFTSLQIEGAATAFSLVFGYISKVLLASLLLLFGFVVAWFVRRIVMAVGTIVGNNPANLIANVTYFATVIFAALQAALVLGVTIDIIRLVIIALLAAGFLAFGLAGRETASDWLKKFASRVNK